MFANLRQTNSSSISSSPSNRGPAQFSTVVEPSVSVPRLAIVGLGFVLLFAAIAWRLADLNFTYRGADAVQRAELRAPSWNISNLRAPILDRNGELLAANLNVKSVWVDPRDIIDPDYTAQQLQLVFPHHSLDWLRAQVTNSSHFRWIERIVSPQQEQAVRRLGLPGVRFSEESQRFYPKGELTSHILGYTGLDNIGLSGLEYSFEELLANNDEPVYLSLDVRAQHIVAEELQRAMDDFTAPSGSAVLMDTNTGEIVSMVSLPSFDPYELGQATEDELFNRASMGVYELGSIFKVFTLAMAMEMNGLRPTDQYNVGRPLHIGRWEITDFKPYGPMMTVAEIMARSSNKGTAQMALEVGAQNQRNFLRDIGLLSEPQFELTQVGKPGYPLHWGQIHTATVSYGHGISVSPLQATNAFASMINGGTFRQPTLLRSESGYRPGVQVMEPSTSHDVTEILRAVVQDGGTGRNANAVGFDVGGKTGTADVQTAGGYDENRRISSFIGGFPMHNPQYSLLVVVYDPQPNEDSFGYATGGWVAAPAFKRMVERLGPVLGVQPIEVETEE